MENFAEMDTIPRPGARLAGKNRKLLMMGWAGPGAGQNKYKSQARAEQKQKQKQGRSRAERGQELGR